MEQKKIGWGILGAGNIAGRFAQSLAHEPASELVAISGRSAERLDAFAASHPVEARRRYVGHSGLLEDPAVDAVYLALPHGLHAQWACRALRAGKAVLCEKPAALSAQEVEAIACAARASGSLFMEAMKPRFTPLHARVMEVLRSGELGAVVGVTTQQLVPMPRDRGGYLADPVQGGVLYDMGIYNASWIEELLQGAIELASVEVRLNGAVDWYDDARLTVGGVPARLEVSGEAQEYLSRCHVACERGSVDIDLLHRPTHATVRRADGAAEAIDAPYEVDDFYGEIRHFAECLRAGLGESPVMPLAASVRQAQIIDAVRAGS